MVEIDVIFLISTRIFVSRVVVCRSQNKIAIDSALFVLSKSLSHHHSKLVSSGAKTVPVDAIHCSVICVVAYAAQNTSPERD